MRPEVVMHPWKMSCFVLICLLMIASEPARADNTPGSTTSSTPGSTPGPYQGGSNCVQSFPFSPSADYSLPRMEAEIFAPPSGSTVYFQVRSSTSHASTNGFFALPDKNHNLWWTMPPNFRPGQTPLGSPPNSLHAFTPEDADLFTNSGQLNVAVVMSYNNDLYCLTERYTDTLYDSIYLPSVREPDLVQQISYATDLYSPIYAMVRVRWTPADRLSCVFEGNGHININNMILRCTFSPADKRRNSEIYFGFISKYDASTSEQPGDLLYGNLDWNVVGVSPKKSDSAGAISGGYSRFAPLRENDGHVLKNKNMSQPMSLQPVSVPIRQKSLPPLQRSANFAQNAIELTLDSRFGTLRCDVSADLRVDIKSGKAIPCVFASVSGTRPYHATIGRVAEDFGSADNGSFSWTVVPPTTATLPLPGGVGGTYSAPVAPPIIQTGVDIADPILLQPSPIQDDESRQNLASGVLELTLTPLFDTLRCDVSAGLQADIKSGKAISCDFTSVSGTSRPCLAKIDKVAADFALADKGSFFWTVVPSPTAALPLARQSR
jgi:hypothetical protein